MRGIVLPALRHGKSSRGTPRLRRVALTSHGALRLAARTTDLNSWRPLLLADADDTFTSPSGDISAASTLLNLFAASGGILLRLDWPALTPALTEIRLFD